MVNVVVLSTVLPRASRAGGDLGSRFFVDSLRRSGAEVAVLGYDRPGEAAPRVPWEVCAGERPIETSQAGARAAIWYLGSLIARRSYSQQKYVSRAYRRALRRILATRPPTVVIVDKAQSAWAAAEVPSRIPIIYVAHNVESDMYARQAAESQGPYRRLAYGRESRLMAAAERALVERAAATWCFGSRDAEVFRARFPGARIVEFVPAGHAESGADRSVDMARDVGLLGTWSWEANRIGLEWFVQEVAPQLERSVTIEVAGIGADWLNDLDAVRYLGRVPDAGAFVASSRVVALPSRTGSGIQIKALGAIAAGAQVVATPLAVAGFDELPSFVDVREGADEFADTLAERVRDPGDGPQRRREGVAWITRTMKKFDVAVRTELDAALSGPDHGSRSSGRGGRDRATATAAQ